MSGEKSESDRPAGLLRHLSGRTRNSDGAFHLLDGSLVAQHLTHEINDQQRIFLVLLNRFVQGLPEGKLADGITLRSKAQPIALLARVLVSPEWR